MTKAKVISMKMKIGKKKFVNIVTTVDPSVTPELVCQVYRLNGKIVSTEVSKIMPLPIALFKSFRLKLKLGII